MYMCMRLIYNRSGLIHMRVYSMLFLGVRFSSSVNTVIPTPPETAVIKSIRINFYGTDLRHRCNQ